MTIRVSSTVLSGWLTLLIPWLLAFAVLERIPTAAAADSASPSTPLIPKTTGSSAATSAVPRPAGPNIPHVTRPNNKDNYDDDGVTGPRLCRNVDNDDVLLRVLRNQCLLPINDQTFAADVADLPSWSPWTHPPACSESNTTAYCVFTRAHYGGGISVIATPETAAGLATILDRAAVAASSAPSTKKINPALLGVQEVPGKNVGVVARQAIARGTVLLRDHARILADVQFPLHMRRARGQELLHKAAGRLPVPEDVRGLSRSVKAKPGEAPGVLEENILSTNSFAATVDGVAYMALFPKIARINHACKPTAITRFNDRDLTQQVIAFRDIEPGEEITISYTDFGLIHQERQEKLTRRWGFTCTCDLCRGGPDAVAASDARRRRVAALRGEIVAHLDKSDFSAAIRAYEGELLGLVRAEHLAQHFGEHYEVLARLHLAAGNRTAAGACAQRALDEMDAFEGGGEEDGGGQGTARSAAVAASVRELRAFVQALKGQERRKKGAKKVGSSKGSKSEQTHGKRADGEKASANSRQEAAEVSGHS